MSVSQPLSVQILGHIARQLQVPVSAVVATLALLGEGGTVPFIARYRKEATGNLDEVVIGAIVEQSSYFQALEERRATVLDSISSQRKLTPELQTQIEAAIDKSVLEDLYLPYRPKRRTKATIAREKGLEPLAQYLWDQAAKPFSLSEYALTFVDPAKSVESPSEALEGARHILAERISETSQFRAHLRRMMMSDGFVVSRKLDDGSDPDGRFKMYYQYSEPAAKIPSHRMLAIRRGSDENVLSFQIELDARTPISYLKSKVIRRPGEWVQHLELTIEDAWKRLLNLSIQTEVRTELKERSDAEAIRVFRENLQNLLLSPPAGMLGVIGVDPGLRTGCKLAVVDETGKFLDHGVMYPLEPKKDAAGSSRLLKAFVDKYNVRAIAIGNGTGSREVAVFVQAFLRESKPGNVFSVVVNESGASIYSASEIARQEFPTLDLTVRGAISIARRLQDPLAELVKIDPKSIGVGQYQHDVDQRRLEEALNRTIEACVNRVGVDLNTASSALLLHVAGINERTAHKIVEYRDQKGRFVSRSALRLVPGFGPKTFEQSAGFLRIRGGENPLDVTSVHPESYPIVEKMASSLGKTMAQLIANPALVDHLKLEEFQTSSAGMYTLHDIREELRRPGRDPREKFVAPEFHAAVNTISDLAPGMSLEGVITNVTNFGAFVDIGVHHDGLVHVSELSSRFVKDPYDVVKVGQIVRVQVISTDPKTKRIALSIKALMESCLPISKHALKQSAAPKPSPSIEDKLSSVSERLRTR